MAFSNLGAESLKQLKLQILLEIKWILHELENLITRHTDQGDLFYQNVRKAIMFP